MKMVAMDWVKKYKGKKVFLDFGLEPGLVVSSLYRLFVYAQPGHYHQVSERYIRHWELTWTKEAKTVNQVINRRSKNTWVLQSAIFFFFDCFVINCFACTESAGTVAPKAQVKSGSTNITRGTYTRSYLAEMPSIILNFSIMYWKLQKELNNIMLPLFSVLFKFRHYNKYLHFLSSHFLSMYRRNRKKI